MTPPKTGFFMTQEQQQIVYRALHAQANWIETGDPTCDAKTAQSMRDPEFERRYGRGRGPEVKQLNDEQVRFVAELRELANCFL